MLIVGHLMGLAYHMHLKRALCHIFLPCVKSGDLCSVHQDADGFGEG